MYEIEFRKEGVIVKKRIHDELLGEKTIEENYTYGELSKMNGLELKVKMPIKPVVNNGVLVAIVMDVVGLSKLDSNNTEPYEFSKVGQVFGTGIPENVENRLRAEKYPDYIRQYTLRRYKKGSLEYTIAEIIRDRKIISDNELREELKRRGYSGRGGSVGAAIRVLRDVTEEIEVKKRGKDKRYCWIE